MPLRQDGRVYWGQTNHVESDHPLIDQVFLELRYGRRTTKTLKDEWYVYCQRQLDPVSRLLGIHGEARAGESHTYAAIVLALVKEIQELPCVFVTVLTCREKGTPPRDRISVQVAPDFSGLCHAANDWAQAHYGTDPASSPGVIDSPQFTIRADALAKRKA